MITEHDLQEAIAECEGQRNPNANTCIKLAAFYTIRQFMFGPPNTYSYATSSTVEDGLSENYESDTEFFEAIKGWSKSEILELMDEVMNTLRIVNPRLYDGVMRKL